MMWSEGRRRYEEWVRERGGEEWLNKEWGCGVRNG